MLFAEGREVLAVNKRAPQSLMRRDSTSRTWTSGKCEDSSCL